ncbi:MAG TPA: signal peptidase I [Anaerolineales bacterium]
MLQFSPTPEFISTELRNYLLFPLLWIEITFFALWGLGHDPGAKSKLTLHLASLAVGAGLLQVIFMLVSGWVWGVGHSPYKHQFPAILGNVFYFTFMTVGLETARGYLLNYWSKRSSLHAFIFIVIFFAILVIPPGGYHQLLNGSPTFNVLGEDILPSLSQSLLLTYLVWIGGPAMAIIYMLFPTYFELLSPILPDLNWIETAFLHTLLPIGIVLLVSKAIDRGEEQEHEEGRFSYSWFYVALFGIGLLWFNSGLFGMRTYLVAGGSMEPNLKAGDVVIIKKGDTEVVQIGDVILFSDDSKAVLHRVIDIKDGGDVVEFITQGDANNTADAPVRPRQVEGKAILKIPKIGWLSLQIKGLLAWLI